MGPMDERLDGGSARWWLWRVSSIFELMHVKYPRSHSCDPSRARHQMARSRPSSLPASTAEFPRQAEKKLPPRHGWTQVFPQWCWFRFLFHGLGSGSDPGHRWGRKRAGNRPWVSRQFSRRRWSWTVETTSDVRTVTTHVHVKEAHVRDTRR